MYRSVKLLGSIFVLTVLAACGGGPTAQSTGNSPASNPTGTSVEPTASARKSNAHNATSSAAAGKLPLSA